MEAPPSDSYLVKKPYFINLYAAGYLGYLNLKQMAGLGTDATVQNRYNHMLSLRTTNYLSTFKDTPYWLPGGQSNDATFVKNLQQILAPSRNYMFMTPELGNYINQNVPAQQLKTMADEYNYIAPYWFVSRFDDSYGEATLMPLYSTSILLNKAYMQKQQFSEVVKYLDAPAFKVGDLLYIQNLVAVLSAPGDLSVTPAPTPTPAGILIGSGNANGMGLIDFLDIREILGNWLKSSGLTPGTGLDQFGDSKVNSFDFVVVVKALGF